jgi:hypothetical protein
MKTHDEMVQEWMQDPAFVREYDGLEQEFALFDEMLRARKEAGLTQAEVAEVCPGDLLGDRDAVDAIHRTETSKRPTGRAVFTRHQGR